MAHSWMWLAGCQGYALCGLVGGVDDLLYDGTTALSPHLLL